MNTKFEIIYQAELPRLDLRLIGQNSNTVIFLTNFNEKNYKNRLYVLKQKDDIIITSTLLYLDDFRFQKSLRPFSLGYFDLNLDINDPYKNIGFPVKDQIYILLKNTEYTAKLLRPL